MTSSLKRILVVLGVLVGGVAVLAGVALAVFIGKIPELFVEPVYADHRAKLDAALPAIREDAALLTENAATLFPPLEGGADAGVVLNGLFPVAGRDQARVPGMVVPERQRRDEVFAGLKTASFWDLDSLRPTGPGTETAHFRLRPAVSMLKQLAQARVADGLPDDAERLARLALTTENLQFVEMGLRLLAELHPDDAVAFRRAARLAQAQSVHLQAPIMRRDTLPFVLDESMRPFRCAGLAEGLSWSIALRDLIESDFESAFVDVGTVLERTTGECRLTWLRGAWARRSGGLPRGPRAFCDGQPLTGLCTLPDAVFGIDRLRRPMGGLVAALTLRAPLSGYAAALPTP